MIYYTKTGEQELKLDITTSPDGHTTVKMPDGTEFHTDFDAIEGDDLFSLLVNHLSHEVYVKQDEDETYTIILDGQIYNVEVETERQHRFATLAHSGRNETGDVTIKAPMPGLVTIVSVNLGDTVEHSQRLLVLEAMKMENEIRAPRAGTVKAINVQRGQTVEQNKVLLVLE